MWGGASSVSMGIDRWDKIKWWLNIDRLNELSTYKQKDTRIALTKWLEDWFKL